MSYKKEDISRRQIELPVVCSPLSVVMNGVGKKRLVVNLRHVNVYCPECPPRGTFGHPGGQQKKFLPFDHGRDLVAFNGTGL